MCLVITKTTPALLPAAAGFQICWFRFPFSNCWPETGCLAGASVSLSRHIQLVLANEYWVQLPFPSPSDLLVLPSAYDLRPHWTFHRKTNSRPYLCNLPHNYIPPTLHTPPRWLPARKTSEVHLLSARPPATKSSSRHDRTR